MHEYYIEKIKKLKNFDFEAEKAQIHKDHPDDAEYPRLCGVLQFWVKEAISTSEYLLNKLLVVDRRKAALEWAAETVLKGDDIRTFGEAEVYEVLYASADVVEHAMREGWNDEKIRVRLQTEIQDDEIEIGRFIDQNERCVDCSEFIGDENNRCEECQEVIS